MHNVQFATPLIVLFAILLTFSGCSKKAQIKTEQSVPQSIVALSPSAAEILFAVGAGNQVSAVSEFTDYPPEASKKPVVGGFDGKTISMESILSFKPDLVYITDGMHNFMIEQLDSYGIQYYLSKADSIATVEQEILDIGKITGHQSQAETVVSQMKQKIDGAMKQVQNQNCNVYYEVWNSPFISAGSKSYISDVLAVCGGKNIFNDIDDAYPMVSEESIISRKPDVIFIPQSSGIRAEDVKNRSGWDSIPAVVNNRIFIIDDNVYTRPGPRVADVVEEISEFLKI